MTKYQASEKLWKVVSQLDGYYYELRCKGVVIDRVKITTDKQLELVDMGLING